MASRELHNQRALREFLVWQRDVRGCSPLTISLYDQVLTALTDALGPTDVARASTDHLQEFVNRDNHAASTRARDVGIVRSWYSYLAAQGQLYGRDPSRLLAAPKHRTKNPKALDDATWLRTWLTDMDVPDRVLLGLGMFLGLRRAELAALQPEHVNVERGLLEHFVRKGGGDDVMPYLDLFELWADRKPTLRVDLLVDVFEPFVDKRRGHEFLLMDERHTHPNCLNDRVRRLGAPFQCHALRHSFVTNLLSAGVELSLVTELANHSSPQVTWRYVRTGGGRLRSFMDRGIH